MDTCLITGIQINPISQNNGRIWYAISVNGVNLEIKFPKDFVIDSDLGKYIILNKHILEGHIYNKKWLKQGQEISINALDKLTTESNYPKTPFEKRNLLFKCLCSYQGFEGMSIHSEDFHPDSLRYLWKSLYFKTYGEFAFYFNALANEDLIEISTHSSPGMAPHRFNITMKGLEYAIQFENGPQSNNCFVAMSFSPETRAMCEPAIIKALNATGFTPIIIDKEHLDSDVTINDGILASIKRSKFTIADFTENRRGVYFEAGYALGRGQSVIYTCRKDYLEKLHFDINHYQHIVWETEEELERKLTDKIEVFIKK